MKIKALVQSLDEVQEDLRPYYKEVKGKGFVFVAEGFEDEAKDVYDSLIAPELRNALERERDKRRKAGDRLAKYEELGDEGKLAQLVADYEKTLEAAQSKVDPALLEQIKVKHREEVAARDKQIAMLTRSLEEATIDRDVEAAIAVNGGRPELLRPFVRQYVQLVKDGDRYATRVLADDRESVRVGDSEGTPMSPEQFVASLKAKEQFQGAFTIMVKKGDGAGDAISGKKAGEGAGAFAHVKARSDFKNDAEKIAFVKEQGRAAFEALPRE